MLRATRVACARSRGRLGRMIGAVRYSSQLIPPPAWNDDEEEEDQVDEVPHAVVSAFDMFSIGIGPSSSHTVGPMRAAAKFVQSLSPTIKQQTDRIRVELFGSLALTGEGHGTPSAILLGLEGWRPEDVDPVYLQKRVADISAARAVQIPMRDLAPDEHPPLLDLQGSVEHRDPDDEAEFGPLELKKVRFSPNRDFQWRREHFLPLHSNGMRLWAFDEGGDMLACRQYYSIGGGFVVAGDEADEQNAFHMHEVPSPLVEGEAPEEHLPAPTEQEQHRLQHKQDVEVNPKFRFRNAAELLALCRAYDMRISEIIWENELAWRDEALVRRKLLDIWDVMKHSIDRGMETRGMLPGRLGISRRAPGLGKMLQNAATEQSHPLQMMGGSTRMDWLAAWAIAVNEENACGGRVVTAPTNGAAGVIPAVVHYYLQYHRDPCEDGIVQMLLCASAIGMLFKRGASISAAEVGCQGEVGVAASMAAAALTEVVGGTPEQVCNAAEIAMEHSLGLTCDPIDGLVQVPCIERNAVGAAKAVTASRLALCGDGRHRVSLDAVIATMKQTGIDMQSKYKETSLGGLAVSVPVC